jgi:endonuclease/exonuclease/phosphatase (EEP) superfamily protein YafD
MTSCRNCGFALSPASRYCEECGASRNFIPESERHPVRRRAAAVARRLLIALAMLYPLALLALTLLNTVRPRRAGMFAVTEVFAPYLFLGLVAVLPFALLRGAKVLRVLLLVCAAVFLVRFPPGLAHASPPPNPGAIRLDVMTWNVLVGGWPEEILEVLRQKPASIVALTEADWGWLSTDPEVAALYPYRWGDQPGSKVSGQALLTTYPIIEKGVVEHSSPSAAPRVIWARLDVGLGRNVVVVVAHPPPARSCVKASIVPVRCYDPSVRDELLAEARAFVQSFLDAGDPLLLLGDFNVTDREPAYDDISRGLTDAFKAVGVGTGTTWRPGQLSRWDWALLRIDYLFSGPGVVPLSSEVDCTPRGSDHCIVHGTFEVR